MSRDVYTRCKQAHPCAEQEVSRNKRVTSVGETIPQDYPVHGSLPSPPPRYLIQPLLICVESNLAPSRCRFCYDSPCCPSLASTEGPTALFFSARGTTILLRVEFFFLAVFFFFFFFVE